jgi:hypothetical protein
VTANRYALISAPFAVRPATALRATLERADAEHVAVRLTYPAPVVNADLTDRPATPATGVVTARVDGRPATAAVRDGTALLPAPSGATVTVAAGAARDGFGNANADGVSASS